MAEESKATSLAKEAEVTAEAVKVKAVAADVEGEAAADSVPTVRGIFALPEKDTDPRSAEWKEFQERIKKEAKGIKWVAMSDLAGKVYELLDIEIPNILVAAWKKAQELQTALEKSRSTPDKVNYLGLAEHTINSDHKPSIDVRLRGATVKKIELAVHLEFKLKGFVLKIQNGGIKEMQTGSCEAKGTIKYGTLIIAEKKLEPIELPGSIPIPSSIQYLSPTTASEPARLARQAPVSAQSVKAPAKDIERIEL